MGLAFGSNFPAEKKTGLKATDVLARLDVDGLAVYSFDPTLNRYKVVVLLGADDNGNIKYHMPDGDIDMTLGNATFIMVYGSSTLSTGAN